ncbi:glycosyltransferase family 2 protein [Anaeromyxobacter oryzae]|uniref:Glycosyl transferase n=1 Tax=Anaeromyxobacter oryzae TaxID=2918170 RepID=A0ABM7WV99_9BACT|nr:glycosyltransferase family 2 protein [Anaeromyxobacter oryzae]BDG03419.1 glycosyl transferase [Anaeromyxobacter oryzae]
MLGISIAIITYNEERALADCIRSCEDIADEIVVLDSFSTDGTEAVARAFPKVRFAQHAFDGHVEQKTRAVALCRNEWILALDADERLTPELREEIRALEPGDLDGFRVPRLTFAMGEPVRHSGWYPQRKVRLFRRSRARWAGDNPHDYVVVDGKGGDLRGDLLHHSFRDLADQATRANAFSSIQAFNLLHRGRRFSALAALVRPVVKFLEVYVYKRGFLDGFAGFTIAVNAAYATFLKFAKIYELEARIVDRPSNVRPEYRPQSQEHD